VVVGVALGQVGLFNQAVDEGRVGAFKVFLHEFCGEDVAAHVDVFS